MSKRIKVGDVFEIPLSKGRKAYGQYVFRDQKMGPLVQIFDHVYGIDDRVDLEQLGQAGLLFPPVITGLFAAIKTGLWEIIGRLPVENFVYPKFISAMYDSRRNRVGIWYVWDGAQSIPIGQQLSEEFKQLEQLVVWDPLDIVHRIETGDNPLSYRLNL